MLKITTKERTYFHYKGKRWGLLQVPKNTLVFEINIFNDIMSNVLLNGIIYGCRSDELTNVDVHTV